LRTFSVEHPPLAAVLGGFLARIGAFRVVVSFEGT
jgi:hypothetical protein